MNPTESNLVSDATQLPYRTLIVLSFSSCEPAFGVFRRYDRFRKDAIIYNCYTTKPSSKCPSSGIIRGYVRERNDANECLKETDDNRYRDARAARASDASEQRRTTFRITLNALATGDTNSLLACITRYPIKTFPTVK